MSQDELLFCIQRFMRIGTAGWTIPREFSEKVGSEGTHLQRYSRVFNCAEINSSFHRSHRASTWQNWAKSVPEHFVFSVKAPKSFTHVNSLKVSQEELASFIGEASNLGDRLGPLLFQLPPKLALDAKIADRSLSALRSRFSGAVAWEPRHPSWFSAEAESLLVDYDVSRVAADPAVVPAAALPGGSRRLAYFRLHGSPRKYYSSYSEEFLSQLAKNLVESESAEVWCIFDNTASGSALGNAIRLRELVRD